MEKSQARKYFGLDERKPYFQSLLKEFKESQFAEGYLSPTYRVVLIDVNLFEEFLRDKQEKKFR